jgi:hypothetical protein
VQQLVPEGNVRRIIIKDHKDRTIVAIPLIIGGLGALLAPMWAAIGGIAALTAPLTIEVETASEAPQPCQDKSGAAPTGRS